MIVNVKKCSKCSQVKEVAEFYRNKRQKDGLRSECKLCAALYDSTRDPKLIKLRCHNWYVNNKTINKDRCYQWNHDNPKKRKSHVLKHTYNITIEEYDNLLKSQNNLCAICGQSETRKLKNKICQLSIDHDHKTGRTRGLLCNRCNQFLGYIDDDIGKLLNAIKYLQN